MQASEEVCMRTALATALLALAACNGAIRNEYDINITDQQQAVLERAENTLAAAEAPGETLEELEATLVMVEDLLRYLVVLDGRASPGLFEDRVRQLIGEAEDRIVVLQEAIDRLWETQ
jgi:hypothetical protein